MKILLVILNLLFAFLHQSSFGMNIFDNTGSVKSFDNAVLSINTAIVSIRIIKEIPVGENPLLKDQFFKRFFENEDPKKIRKSTVIGSGILMNNQGYVLTSNQIITYAKSFSIELSSGKIATAKVIGSDPKTDLAVLKITNLKDVPNILPLKSSSKPKVGDVVLAIGGSYSGTKNTKIKGVITSIDLRSINNLMTIIYTKEDAIINQGISGGALITSDGNIIGINTIIITTEQDVLNNTMEISSPVGYAIPIDLAKKIAQQIIDLGYVSRAWLGVFFGEQAKDDVNYKNQHIVYVKGVYNFSSAAKAGIIPGDVIIKINNIAVKNVSSVYNIVSNLDLGKSYIFEILRKGKYISVPVLMLEIPK